MSVCKTCRPTFAEAKAAMCTYLANTGWKLSDPNLKIPHATSPDGRVRIWCKPQALWVSNGPPHTLAGALSTWTDVRDHSPQETVRRVLDYAKGLKEIGR